MPTIAKLFDNLPEISQSRLVASGFGVWITWKGKFNSAIEGTFREYGALCLSKEPDQALWFCNSTEVFRALARLQIWARVNPMPTMCQVVPMTFLVGYDMEMSVSLSPELDRQDARTPDEFEIIIHPKLKEQVESVAGLSIQVAGMRDGLAAVEWLRLVADQGLDYESNKKWYYVIKPLGKMSDKDSILGWRDFSSEIIELLQRLGLKYISDVKEGVIFFPLDNFQLFRSFCSEILQLIKQTKNDPEKKHWPVVMVAISQDGLPFSTDLPKKVGLDWNRLAPDFPHVRFIDGFLLSEWFRMDEARYGSEAVSLESWCTLALREGGEKLGSGTMHVALPNALSSSEGVACYYCGQTNHEPSQCPTKKLLSLNSAVWNELANVNLNDFSLGFQNLDKKLAEGDFAESMFSILESSVGLESVLAQAVYEINSPCQLRMLKIVWRSRAKDWSDSLKQLAPQEGEYIWDALRCLEDGDQNGAETLIREAQLKYPRSYQPHSLWGFWNVEKGDYTQALFHWQEAERMSYTSLQQGYFSYLQARLQEVDGNIKEALNTFKQANTSSPTWVDPVYRQGVCMVKMGFTGQAMDLFFDLIERDPHVFNRILIDPELDRGRVQLMSALWERWADSEKTVEQAREQVAQFVEDIAKRFDTSHSYFETANEELERLREYGEKSNYVAYRMLIRGTERFNSTLDAEVKREIKRIDANLEYQSDRVRDIQKEAAWFPFPKLLMEFNKDFNFCVDKINWIRTQRLKEADNFRRSLKLLEEIEERIDTLQGRLVTLRIIRDSTLFVLMLGRNFIWFELVGLGLALIAIPATLYFTKDVQGYWILNTIKEQEWEFTKGLIIILSILCLAGATIKSALSFDKRKRELFQQIDDEIRKGAPRRY